MRVTIPFVKLFQKGSHVLLIALVAACGCKNKEETSALAAGKPKAIPAGFKVQAVHGFTIAIPSGLTAIDFTAGSAEELVANIKKEHPESPGLADQVSKLATSGAMKLMAIDTASKDAFKSNFNMLEVKVGGSVTLDQLLDLNKPQVEAMADKQSVKVTKVKLPAADAELIEATLNQTSGKYYAAMYLVLYQGTEYVATYSSSMDNAAKWKKVADQSMKSLSFTN